MDWQCVVVGHSELKGDCCKLLTARADNPMQQDFELRLRETNKSEPQTFDDTVRGHRSVSTFGLLLRSLFWEWVGALLVSTLASNSLSVC